MQNYSIVPPGTHDYGAKFNTGLSVGKFLFRDTVPLNTMVLFYLCEHDGTAEKSDGEEGGTRIFEHFHSPMKYLRFLLTSKLSGQRCLEPQNCFYTRW